MTEEDVERTLREAFDARARASVGDARPAPPPRFAARPAGRGRARVLAPFAAAAAVVAVVGGILSITRDTGGDADHRQVAAAGSDVETPAPVKASQAPRSKAMSAQVDGPAGRVHIRLFNADGARYGVGMPVIAMFSARITDARPFVRATDVTVNGKPIQAAWYFEESAAGLGALEAHLRPESYWPAHANVHVSIATKGLSAGRGLAYDDSLTLDFATGARTIGVVDGRKHVLTVNSDGKQVAQVPVSLGRHETPTSSGMKVIMDDAVKVRMKGPGYDLPVADAQRLTYGGEYLVAAPWNMANIKRHVDTSNGCTDLLPADAKLLFDVLRVGDVLRYVNTTGRPMQLADGFGDWNVPWSTWRTGGLLPTS